MVLFTDIFKLESDPQGTAIKATDNERYLSIHIDGEGVPDANPTFTASNSSGSSTATIKVRRNFGAKQCSTQNCKTILYFLPRDLQLHSPNLIVRIREEI